MNSILSELSIFHKVATKEDDYTQILCNLMKRQEGKELRTSVLSMILGNSDLASQVSPDQIDTQVSMREAGRPDLIVESPVVYAVIEVKLNPRRGLTAYHFFCFGYCAPEGPGFSGSCELAVPATLGQGSRTFQKG